ncbi:MAG: hypothetical protein N4A46_02950, partial [Schleiferiaceae bacterium]|nr:hypothetical protein [Schleiferiaceae bacterium]
SSAKNLYKIYKEIGKSDESLFYYEVYIQLNDSIQNEENERVVIRNQYKHQYEKQALADSLEFQKQKS